jgi:transposase
MHLSSGECHDAPEGNKSLEAVGEDYESVPVLMDKAYESVETRALAQSHGHPPVVPPKANRKQPWKYDRELYKKRNVVERFFRRIKAFRRIFTRYDKLDEMFLGYIYFAVAIMWLR